MINQRAMESRIVYASRDCYVQCSIVRSLYRTSPTDSWSQQPCITAVISSLSKTTPKYSQRVSLGIAPRSTTALHLEPSIRIASFTRRAASTNLETVSQPMLGIFLFYFFSTTSAVKHGPGAQCVTYWRRAEKTPITQGRQAGYK